MPYFDRIDVPAGTDVNKTSESKRVRCLSLFVFSK